MNFTVMQPTERHNKLVADFHSQSAWLCESKMVRIGGLPSTLQAGLISDEFQVIPVADAARKNVSQHTCVSLYGPH